MEKKRSIGIWGLSVYLLLLIVFNWIPNMITLRALPQTPSRITAMIEAAHSPSWVALNISFLIIMGVHLLITSVIFLAGSIFILQLKNWARLTIIYCCVVLLAIVVYLFIVGFPSTDFAIQKLYSIIQQDPVSYHINSSLFNFLIYVLPVLYLTRPKVKEQFK